MKAGAILGVFDRFLETSRLTAPETKRSYYDNFIYI